MNTERVSLVPSVSSLKDIYKGNKFWENAKDTDSIKSYTNYTI